MDFDRAAHRNRSLTDLVGERFQSSLGNGSRESDALLRTAVNAVCGVPSVVVGLPEGVPAPSTMELVSHAAVSVSGMPEHDALTISLALEAIRVAVSAVFELRASAFPTALTRGPLLVGLRP